MNSKSRKLLAFMFQNFFSAAVYTMMAPFYPPVMHDKGVSFSLIGFIFAAFPLVSLIASPFVGKYLYVLGRRNTFVFGVFMNCLSLFLIASVEELNYELAIAFSIISRMLAGLSYGWVLTSSLAVVASEFPESVKSVIGSLEAISGIGMILGPLIGSGLYYFSNFAGVFFITGTVNLIFVPICWWLIKKDTEYENKTKKSVWTLMSQRTVLLDGINVALLQLAVGFIDPILAAHMKDNYGYDQIIVGLMFWAASILYGLMVPVVSMTKLDPGIMMYMGTVILGVSYYFIGPFTLAGIPSHSWIVIVACASVGISGALMNIPVLPHMIDRVSYEEGLAKDDKLLDIMSSILTTYLSLGQIIGPIAGGALSDVMTVNNGCALLASIILAFSIIYLLLVIVIRKEPKMGHLYGPLVTDDEIKESEMVTIR